MTKPYISPDLFDEEPTMIEKDNVTHQIAKLKEEIEVLDHLLKALRAKDNSETAIWLSSNAAAILEEGMEQIEKQVKDLK